MLYYRLYKRMKQKLGYDAGALIPLDYGLFAIIFPMIAGCIIGGTLQGMGLIGDRPAYFVVIFGDIVLDVPSLNG